MNPFRRIVTVGPTPEYLFTIGDRQSKKTGETAIGGRYAIRHVVLRPDAESSATGVSLTALMECVHSDGAILPGRKYFLLMNSFTNFGSIKIRS